MADPERRGNIFGRVLGSEAFEDFGGSKPAGVIAAIVHMVVPLTERAVSDKGRPSFSLRRIFFSYILDLGVYIFALKLVSSGRVAEGVALKLAYNLGVEVVPDALRAVRRKFSPPPSGLDF